MMSKRRGPMGCAPSSAEREAARRAKNAAWMRAWRAAHPTGRSRGGQRKHFTAEAVAQAHRDAVRRFRASPARVAQSWYREQFRRSSAQIRFEAECDSYAEWCAELDMVEIPPGVDLSAALWGSVPRARDGALP